MGGAILAAVRDVVRAEIGRDAPIGPETDLIEDLGLDSLALLSITVELENRFSVCLGPEDDRALTRVGDVARLLEREIARSGAGA